MSNPNEEEKLTPSSAKGYDGDSTQMAEKPEIENSDEEKDPHDSEVDPHGEDKPETNEQQNTETKKNTIAEMFSALLSSVNPENGGPEDKIFKTVVEAVTDATSKNKNPNKAIAEVMSSFLLPNKPAADSTEEELEGTKKARVVFDTILESAEEAHLDSKAILKELAGIAKEQQEELPTTAQDRYVVFEQHLKKTLNTASDEALQIMHEDLKKLRAEIANDTQLDEGVYDAVLDSETLLAELVEVKEDTATQEFIEIQQANDKKFAQVIVTVFESVAETRFTNLTLGKEVNLRSEEQLKADHLMKLLLASDDPKQQKQELVAALLTSYPVAGSSAEQQEALAMRERIMGYAKLAELDEKAILDNQAIIAAEDMLVSKTDAINDSESIVGSDLNAFERKVEQQIANASAERVKEIRYTWKDLLESVDPNSETAREAREAIAVLDNIIQLKEMQAARDRGEAVDFSTLPAPKEYKHNDHEAKESASKSESDKELAALLAKLFSPLRKGDKAEDYALVSVITDFILASKHTKEEKEALIAGIAKCFSQKDTHTSEANDIHSYLRIYADSVALAQPTVDAGTSEKDGHEDTPELLQKLIEEALAKVSHKDLIQLKGALGFVAIKEKPSAEIKEQITQTIAFINALPTDKENAKKADASQRPVEKPEKAIKAEDAEKIEERLVEGSMQTTEAKRQSFFEETHFINEENNIERFNVVRLENYANNLKDLGGQLSESELKSAYMALQKQITLSRRAPEFNGNFHLDEVLHVNEISNEALRDIVARLRETMAPAEVMKFINETKRSLRDNKAYNERLSLPPRVYNMEPTVVEASVGNRYYEPGSRFQLGNAINEIRSMSTTPDPALPANLGSDYTEIATNIKTQQEFSNTAVLEDRMHKLNSLMSEGMRAGINLKDMTQAQALAQQLHAQRQEIAVMEQMYKGQMDERTYKAEDEALYEGYIHTALGERIKRIQIELEIKSGLRSRTYVDSSGNTHTHKVRTDEELIAYYTELRKWAKILLKNDVRNNAGKAGQEGALNLSNERFKRYSDIVKALPDSFDLANAADTAAMLSNVNYMFDITTSGGDFLRYFMRNTKNPKGIDPEKHDSIDFNPHELLGVDYRHAEGTSSFGLPKSLEDTMAIMARQYSTEKINYRTGGDHELFDGEGNFKFNNFYYLIREQILNNDILYNKDGQINPMQKITVKGDASSVSLAELLVLMPEYLSQRTFDIVVDNDGDVTSGWGRPTEHPEFTWAQAQQLGAEVEFRIMTHEARIQYVQASLAGDKGKYLQLMEYLHKSNHWVRANNIMWLLGLPSAVTNGSQEIIDVVGPKETQGTLGKAVSDMLVGYNYINEVSKYYKHANGEEKTFNENMFYRFWEPNGANKFLVTMTEETLNNYSDAKREYGRFIQERIQAAAVRARSLAGGDAVKLEKIDRQLQDQTQAIQAEMDKQNVGLDIRFTKDSHLMKFLQYTEKEVLGRKFRNKKEEEEYFKFTVRDDLLDNLKGGLFTKLADMQVHELDTLVDKNNKTKDRPDTYLFLRAKQNKMRFGDIRFDGQTIEELLNDFNPEQIKRFDYTNKADDPRNHFSAFANDPDRLRRELDTYMDAKINPENYKFFKHNEKMMLAFLKHVTRIDRAWLNHFRDIPENEVVKDMEKRAMEECVQLVHGVDDIEATYAWWQARDYIYIWGIGDWLDDSGIGFRTGGKLFHTGKWRAHRGGKDGAGNKDTFDEFGAVALPFLNTIQIHDIEGHQELGHQSIFSLLQGGHGYNITPRAAREFKPRSRYSIAHDSEELYVANMLSNAAELADLLSTTEVDFTNIVATDPLGNIVFDYGKARELFKKWRKAIRYSYQKNGIDYREKIWVDGQEKTLYEFCFGKKTRAINELIRQETGRSIDDMFRDTADAVMASIIAAEVYEHRKMHLSGHHWTIENVIELEKVIREFMDESDLEEDEHGDVELVRKGNAFTKKVFSGALKAYHTSYEKMYMAELNSSFWGGLFAGLWAGLNASLTKGKWIY